MKKKIDVYTLLGFVIIRNEMKRNERWDQYLSNRIQKKTNWKCKIIFIKNYILLSTSKISQNIINDIEQARRISLLYYYNKLLFKIV